MQAVSFGSPVITAYTWDVMQHHLNEINFISVKSIFSATTAQNVLPHSVPSIKSVPSSDERETPPF